MFSKLVLAAAVALPLGMLGLSGAALADYTTHYYIPVMPIPSAKKPAPAPMVHHAAMVHRGAMSCAAAGRTVRADGYRNVKARDCDDRNYVFHATRHGRPVVLHVNPRNGHVWRA